MDDTSSLQITLENAYGIKAIVKKHRYLFLYGRTRIHLDQVENLGHFIELECVLADHECLSDGLQHLYQLMHALDIMQSDLIDLAYVDLLTAS